MKTYPLILTGKIFVDKKTGLKIQVWNNPEDEHDLVYAADIAAKRPCSMSAYDLFRMYFEETGNASE